MIITLGFEDGSFAEALGEGYTKDQAESYLEDKKQEIIYQIAKNLNLEITDVQIEIVPS